MMFPPACAGQSIQTFLPLFGERVFLCSSAVEKVSQHRSRIAQALSVPPGRALLTQLEAGGWERLRLASSLAAALLGRSYVLARRGGRVRRSLFEQPRCPW